ncbi:MAG: hypothetical protein AB7P02_17245 [Alphaproteobacteria bacterium]
MSDRKLVTVTEYAAMVGVDKSTISRQVARGIIPNRGVPGKPLIDPVEADAARLGGLDPSRGPGALAGQAIATAAAPVAVAEGAPAADTPPPAPNLRGTGYQVARTAREAMNAKLAELDYRERVGELLAKSEVENAMVKIGLEVQRQLDQRVAQLADRLVGIADPARLAALIREADRRLLETMAAAFDRMAKAPPQPAPDEDVPHAA